jgi:hypothetical protein
MINLSDISGEIPVSAVGITLVMPKERILKIQSHNASTKLDRLTVLTHCCPTFSLFLLREFALLSIKKTLKKRVFPLKGKEKIFVYLKYTRERTEHSNITFWLYVYQTISVNLAF